MSKVERFAERMNRIPRKAVRCKLYGTISVVLDRKHARNIFRKVFPLATSEEILDALGVLEDRVYEMQPQQGYRAEVSGGSGGW